MFMKIFELSLREKVYAYLEPCQTLSAVNYFRKKASS